MIRQRTLKTVIRTTGIGVHRGEKIHLTLRPAPVNTGIIFQRVDLNPPVLLPARAANAVDSALCTTLTHNNISIATIEHLMSALAGLGIDNAYIDVDSAEIPIMDGSAAPFVFLIQSAGIQTQSALKKFLRIKEKITVQQGDKVASLEPYMGFKLDFTIQYNHPIFEGGIQRSVVDFNQTTYSDTISRARTFGFLRDAERMREMNLALGASLDNTVVLDDFRVMNEDGLRYPDECVKHKILDAIGDLYLLGYNVLGAFTGHKAGHALNNLLVRTVLARESAWELVTFADQDQAAVAAMWQANSAWV